MFDFDIYNNSAEILKRKEESIYLKFIVVLIIVSFMVLIMIFKDYKDIRSFNGVVTDGEILLYVKEDLLQYFENDVIIFENNEITYKINSIEKIDDSTKNYYKMSIWTNTSLSENDIITFSIDNGKTNLYKSFIKKIWKGFG